MCGATLRVRTGPGGAPRAAAALAGPGRGRDALLLSCSKDNLSSVKLPLAWPVVVLWWGRWSAPVGPRWAGRMVPPRRTVVSP
eukprot:scaffold16175_cov63-Phaeocystis_antarctica.AAC.2